MLRRPREWVCYPGGHAILAPHLLERIRRIPDRPMTRLEFFEELAFAGKEENDGPV